MSKILHTQSLRHTFLGTSFHATSMLAINPPQIERLKLLDSGEIETCVELKVDAAKSTAQLWEELNYDAIYSHLHPLDYCPKVLSFAKFSTSKHKKKI